MNELYERWRTYTTQVIPNDAPEVQRIECRRAYYAGAQAIADMMERLESDLVLPAQRRRELAEFVKEIRQFQADVSAGRA